MTGSAPSLAPLLHKRAQLANLAQGSRFFQRLQRRYTEVFAALPSEPLGQEALPLAYAALRAQGGFLPVPSQLQ